MKSNGIGCTKLYWLLVLILCQHDLAIETLIALSVCLSVIFARGRTLDGSIVVGMDESGNDNTVRILPPLTTSRMRSQLIACQPIRDWQTKG